MVKVGLTGCIGSGKSISSLYFKKLGVPVIDADNLVEKLLVPDNAIFKQIVMHFGVSILHKSGFINKGYLRNVIFSNNKQKKWVESLIHPCVREFIKKEIDELKLVKRQKSKYCIIAIPILPDLVQQYRMLNRICVIDAGVETRINRVALRDKLSYSDTKSIMEKQRCRESYLKIADDVIVNDGNCLIESDEILKTQVYKLHKQYKKNFTIN